MRKDNNYAVFENENYGNNSEIDYENRRRSTFIDDSFDTEFISDTSDIGGGVGGGGGGAWWILTSALLAFGASVFFQFIKPKNKNNRRNCNKESKKKNTTSENENVEDYEKNASTTVVAKAESSGESNMAAFSSIFVADMMRQANNQSESNVELMIECEDTMMDTSSFIANTSQIADDIQKMVDSKEAQEKLLKYHEELYNLWKRLTYVHGLLQKSENKRKTMSEELKIVSNKHEKEAECLKSEIGKQEEENEKIKVRLSQIHQERDSLVNLLNNTQSTLTTLKPNLSQMHGQIGELTSAVRDQKTTLKKLKNELVTAKKEKESINKRIDEYSSDVSDIENLIELVENAKDLISCSDMDLMVERTSTIDNCIKALQSYILKPLGNKKKTKVKDVGNRVIILFERMLMELKKAIKQTIESRSNLNNVQERLFDISNEEKELKEEVECKKNQINGLIQEKASIENNLTSMESELGKAKEKIENSEQLEINMKSGIDTLEQEKETLVSTVDKLEREVAEIEKILQTIEKTREIITSNPNRNVKEQVQILDDCIQVLNRQMMTSSTQGDISKDMCFRLIKMFQVNLNETKDAILKTDECKAKFEETKSNLEVAERDQGELKLALGKMKEKVENLEDERSGLSNKCGDLQKELHEKMEILKNASNKEKEMTKAIEKLNLERDELNRQLGDSEHKLDTLKQSYENEVRESNDAKKKMNEIEREKNSLELQKTELDRRIHQFQDDINKMQLDAQDMESNLEKERNLRNTAELSNRKLEDSKQEMERKMREEISELRVKLEEAKVEKEKMYLEIKKSDEHKRELEARFEKESELLKQRISEMKLKEITIEEEKQSLSSKEEGSSSIVVIEEEDNDEINININDNDNINVNVNDECKEGNVEQSEIKAQLEINEKEDDEPRKKVEDWIDGNVKIQDVISSSERQAPSRNSGSVIERQSIDVSTVTEQQQQSTISSSGSMSATKIQQIRQRRTSWPLDNKITLSNQWYDTVQDMMELTSTSYELAVERETLLSELNDVREAVSEARTQLEEREAEISDLTQQFLQIYQIASDLAADNDNQMSELTQLRQYSEQLKTMLEDRDDRIATFEAQFAAYNIPPPNTSRSHYRPQLSSSSDLNGMAMVTPKTDSLTDRPTTPGSVLSTERSHAREQARSALGSMAQEPQDGIGTTPHPPTPSLMNALFSGDDGSANDNTMVANGVENIGIQLNNRRLDNSSLSSQRDDRDSPVPSDMSSLSSVSSIEK